jgi:Tfp pilus assembly protein PilZ
VANGINDRSGGRICKIGKAPAAASPIQLTAYSLIRQLNKASYVFYYLQYIATWVLTFTDQRPIGLGCGGALMSFKILLVSTQNPSAEKIKSDLERNKLYQVRLVDPSEAMIQIRNSSWECVALNFDTFTPEKLRFSEQFRKSGHRFPIINFASHIHKDTIPALNRIDRTVIIEKPYETKDVWGIAQKLLQGRSVSQRVFRRFYTDQQVTIEKTQTGQTQKGNMFNMSRGGAYIEIDNHNNFQSGDILKMTIPLDKVSKSYAVDVEVVWKSDKGYWKGGPAVGVRFVKNDDVYRNLLNRL